LSNFKTIILEEADLFIGKLDLKSRKKLFYAIRTVEVEIDPKFFKKLRNHIWEFKVQFSKKQIRLLAFWDKRDETDTLVIATHGFIKKTQKTPLTQIEKAEKIRAQYFNRQLK